MKRVFLLGGGDLEMQTVCDVLKESGEFFIDHGLSWGNAYVSNYLNELDCYRSHDYRIYGVELIEDVPVPENYIKIDHHNELCNMPSSLEQVAAILGYKLNRKQCLIAANDSNYIAGMFQLGATRVEVEEIRRLDRAFQGVTDLQEKQAVEDLKRNLVCIDDLYIVFTSLDRFSPITDRLYPYKHLIIYNDSEMVYYGEMKLRLVSLFHTYITNSDMYYGGGDSGFLGTVSCRFTKDELLSLIEKIKSIYRHEQ